MSADSQSVEILDGENRVLSTGRHNTRNPVVIRWGGGFVGLVGFAGTESIEGVETAEWLRRFSADHPEDDIETFCARLRDRLTEVWHRDNLPSVLEILIAGEVSGDLQFWFVRNSQGLRDSDWKHQAPANAFVMKNDLDDPDEGYVQRDSEYGETKGELLQRLTYSFRQGVLLPAAPVFDGFGGILRGMYEGGVEGFAPVASLDDLGHFARVRMEFLKRLCSSKHGIYAEGTPTPVDGEVHVYGVGRDGRICDYRKNKVVVLRPGRTDQPPIAVDVHAVAQREAEHKAAALHHVGWETGVGAAIWARVVQDDLALHEAARERFEQGSPTREDWDRFHGSALTLVVAIHQVQAFEHRVRRLTGGDRELAEARARFDFVAPDAERLRDLVAHLDAYAVGQGQRQTGEKRPLITDPYLDTFLYWTVDDSYLRIGDEQMSLGRAARAAVALAEVVERVRVKHLAIAEREANAAFRLQYGMPPE